MSSTTRPGAVSTQQHHAATRWFQVKAAAAVTASNDTNGNPTQWIYTVSEAYKSGIGYEAWTLKAADVGYRGNGYNVYEDENSGTGQQGNGINHDGGGYLATYSMQAIPLLQIVPGVIIAAPSGGGITLEAWIWWMNAEDGTCT